MKHLFSYIVGLSVLFVLLAAHSVRADPTGGRTAICHATSSEKNPYNYLVLPPSALGTHLDSNGSPRAGHEQDFFPVDSDCDRTNDPSGVPEDPPTATPEPLTVILFGAGLTGVGYVSRRYLRKRGGTNKTND